MGRDRGEGNRQKFKGNARVRRGWAGDARLGTMAGRCVAPAGRLQDTHGVAKDEAERQGRRRDRPNKEHRPKHVV